MHEFAKLDEAAYFLSRLSKVIDQPEAFKFELSAFLSAARSALQYAYKEIEGTPSKKAWYDKLFDRCPLLGFFKDKRDMNIHRRPINPTMQVGVGITEVLHLSASLSFVLTNQEGEVIQRGTTSPDPIPQSEPVPAAISYRYTFPDWTGNEDIITLCGDYLTEIRDVVNDGIALGHLKQPQL
jgi:hypothetical protein